MDESISQIVDKVADRLGVASDKLAPVAEAMVREAARTGLFQLVFCFVGFIVLSSIVRTIQKKLWRLKDTDRVQSDVAWAGLFVSSIAGMVLSIVLAVGMYQGLRHFASPTTTVVENLLGR